MVLLKFLLAVGGLAIIAAAVFCFFTELTQAFGFFAGVIGAALVFFIFKSDAVTAFLGVPNGLVDDIALGAMIGGGILCAMDFERLGSAIITAGWVAVGVILLQIVPIPVVASFMNVVSLPLVVICIPLLLLLLVLI